MAEWGGRGPRNRVGRGHHDTTQTEHLWDSYKTYLNGSGAVRPGQGPELFHTQENGVLWSTRDFRRRGSSQTGQKDGQSVLSLGGTEVDGWTCFETITDPGGIVDPGVGPRPGPEVEERLRVDEV